MVVFSKLLGWSMPYNCYEIGHTWTPHCSEAWLQVWYSCFQKSVKLYGLLYLVAQLISRNFTLKGFIDSLKNVFNSSMFLSLNFFFFLMFSCSSRHILGRLYLFPSTFFAGVLASLSAIILETKSRRRMLTFYMLNLSSEIVYRMIRSRGFVKDIPYGEVLIFAASLGPFVYFLRQNEFTKDPISIGLRHLFGSQKQNDVPQPLNSAYKVLVPTQLDTLAHLDAEKAQALLYRFFFISKQSSCWHKRGCVFEAVQNGIKFGLIGWIIGYGLNVASSSKAVFKNPMLVLQLFTNPQNLRQAAFLGGLSGIFRITRCVLRWTSNGNKDWHDLLSGSLAGLSLVACPSSNVSLYTVWKLIEVMYIRGARKKIVPSYSFAPPFLYALCTGIMLFAAMIEPHNLRPAYMKFLDSMSGHRFGLINRCPLDILGYHSSISYPGFFPHLDTRYITKEFLQTVLIWVPT